MKQPPRRSHQDLAPLTKPGPQATSECPGDLGTGPRPTSALVREVPPPPQPSRRIPTDPPMV